MQVLTMCVNGEVRYSLTSLMYLAGFGRSQWNSLRAKWFQSFEHPYQKLRDVDEKSLASLCWMFTSGSESCLVVKGVYFFSGGMKSSMFLCCFYYWWAFSRTEI